MVMKLVLDVDGITTNLYLRIPVDIEDHEMDVTAYDYLQEYYPVASHRLHMSERSWSVDILRGPEIIWGSCVFYPNPKGDASLCDYLGLHEEHKTPRGDVHGRGLKEHELRERIATFCLKVCKDVTKEESLSEEIDLEADDPHLWFTIKDRCDGLLKAYDRLVDQAIWTSEMLGGLEDEERDCLNKTISTLNDRIRTMSACLK